MKHFHMLMAVITILLFLWQSYLVLAKNEYLSTKTKVATHIVYTLLLISGISMVIPLLEVNAPLQWVIAKIILLIAAISASIKAFKPTATPAQSKAGIMIGLVAYIGILVFAFAKPANIF